jgi:hypothetical protein
VAAEEILPGTIENRYPFPALRAKKPGTESAIVAWCLIKGNDLFNFFPFVTMCPAAVIKKHAV